MDELMSFPVEKVIRNWKRIGIRRPEIEAVITALFLSEWVELVRAIDRAIERDRLEVDGRWLRAAFEGGIGVLMSGAGMRARPSDFRPLFLRAMRQRPAAGFLASALAGFLWFHPGEAERSDGTFLRGSGAAIRKPN